MPLGNTRVVGNNIIRADVEYSHVGVHGSFLHIEHQTCPSNVLAEYDLLFDYRMIQQKAMKHNPKTNVSNIQEITLKSDNTLVYKQSYYKNGILQGTFEPVVWQLTYDPESTVLTAQANTYQANRPDYVSFPLKVTSSVLETLSEKNNDGKFGIENYDFRKIYVPIEGSKAECRAVPDQVNSFVHALPRLNTLALWAEAAYDTLQACKRDEAFFQRNRMRGEPRLAQG